MHAKYRAVMPFTIAQPRFRIHAYVRHGRLDFVPREMLLSSLFLQSSEIFIVIPANAGIHFEIYLIEANGYLLSQV